MKSHRAFYFRDMGCFKFFLILCSLVVFFVSTNLAQAKTKSATKKDLTIKLNKQTNDELAKNQDIHNCYLNAKAGQEKQHGVIYLNLDVGLLSEVNSIVLNRNQSTLSADIGNCISEALKSLIIPFKSNERGKKVTVIFRF